MKNFDKVNMAVFRMKLQAALDAVDPDVKIKLGTIRFSAGEASCRLTATVAGGAKEEALSELFLSMCERHKLDHTVRSFEGLKLVGYNPRRPKKSWILEREGRNYIANLDYVKSRFARKED